MMTPDPATTPPVLAAGPPSPTAHSGASGVTVVVGGSRGLGRGIAQALAADGADVVALSRTQPEPAAGVRVELADAAETGVATGILARHDPDTVVIVAGAHPPMRALQDQTWASFSVNWNADVRIAFSWLQAVLRQPLRPGGRVVVISSGAALAGSPLSGGYAGAKASQRFLAAYTREEAGRLGLGITVTTVLPRLTPLTDLGRDAVAAYAARDDLTVDDYLARQPGRPLSPDDAGQAVAGLLRKAPADIAPEYLLTSDGLRPLS